MSNWLGAHQSSVIELLSEETNIPTNAAKDSRQLLFTFGSKFLNADKRISALRFTLILNIPQICVDKDIFVRKTSSLKILFSLERSLSFVRITKSCGRHHLTCPILFAR